MFYTHPPEEHRLPTHLSADIVSEWSKEFDLVSCRVVSKKIVSRLRFPIGRVSFFARDLGQNSRPQYFCNTLNAGLPNFAFTRWRMQYTEREHTKQVLRTRFYLFDYFTWYSGTNTGRDQEFIPDFS